MVGNKVDNDHETYPSVWMDYANEYKMQFCLAHATISKLQKLFGTAGLPPMLKNHFLSWLYEPIMNGLGWTWWGSIFGLWYLKLKPLNLWSGYIFWSVMQVTHRIFFAKQVTKHNQVHDLSKSICKRRMRVRWIRTSKHLKLALISVVIHDQLSA